MDLDEFRESGAVLDSAMSPLSTMSPSLSLSLLSFGHTMECTPRVQWDTEAQEVVLAAKVLAGWTHCKGSQLLLLLLPRAL